MRVPEAEQEVEGRHAWGSHGTVQLFAWDRLPHTIALLLERCEPGTPLAVRPESEQDLVIAFSAAGITGPNTG